MLSKIKYFVTIIKGNLAERLARLFRDNIWNLHKLLENVVLDKEPKYAAELTKKLNKILGIETKQLTLFHSQTDEQINKLKVGTVSQILYSGQNG